MKLTTQARTHERKSDVAKLRRSGAIPGIIYKTDKEGEPIAINEQEFISHLRHVPSGRLATSVFTLEDGKGKGRSAIVKDIQYHPVSYRVLHLDFEELHDKKSIKVKVPIVIEGEVDSVGVKLGGMVRLIVRNVKVQCLPKDIPHEFVVDVKNMNIGDVLRLSDLSMPNTVRPLMNPSVVVVSMVKK